MKSNPQNMKDEVNKRDFDKVIQMPNMQQQSLKQNMSSDHQIKEYSTNIAISSGSLTSKSASSAKSESIVQSKQSQLVNETSSCTLKSFSEQKSESQHVIIQETNMAYDNSTNKIESSAMTNESRKVKSNIEQESLKLIEPKQINSSINQTAVEQEEFSTSAILSKYENNTLKSHETDAGYDQSSEVVKSEKISGKLIHSNDKYDDKLKISEISMVEALTIAPDRPYSPLPSPSPQMVMHSQNIMERKETEINTQQNITNNSHNENLEEENFEVLSGQSPIFNQSKRGITPIPPIKTFNPPPKNDVPVPMPEETKPYIPPDFKIHMDEEVSRKTNVSPFVDALTTAPDRPFTPVITSTNNSERVSLREALTIAPERPFSPLPQNTTNQINHYTSTSSSSTQVYSTLSEIVRPIATQTSTPISNQMHSDVSTMQNTCKLQSSSEMSAFRPVGKQYFPTQSHDYCQLPNLSPVKKNMSDFVESNIKQEINMISESMSSQESTFYSNNMSSQRYSTVKSAQNYFEQLDKKESLTSQAVRSKSGLHKPDSIPPYQKNFEKLPSQRGITPELCNAPATLQRPVTPSTDPPVKPREKSLEPKSSFITSEIVGETHQTKAPFQVSPIAPTNQSTAMHFHKDTPITMTFQPVSEQNFLRTTPNRSRPSTPSLINKPAPIIPHYQMNLVPVEHLAPESHLYEPSSPDVSRSPTPKPRSKSPAQGPPPNPLKAQAPRVKEATQQYHNNPHALLSQATTNLRREHESAQNVSQSINVYNTTASEHWAQQQPSQVKEQKQSNLMYQTENYKKGDTCVKEDSLYSQNYGQREMQSQNVAEYGNATVKTTRKTFEEFERTQSAKVIEIRKGGSSSAVMEQSPGSNIQLYDINPKQNFPIPVTNITAPNASSYANHSNNLTNQNIDPTNSVKGNYQQRPPISGANHSPVCDPTPSTGSSVGAAARGKTFGVSSAPKRGRGVLNKAAMPGSRVPLCASCNGNIR